MRYELYDTASCQGPTSGDRSYGDHGRSSNCAPDDDVVYLFFGNDITYLSESDVLLTDSLVLCVHHL